MARLLARTYDSALAGSDMNVTQLAVLRAVERHGGEPLARVADDLAMERTTLYRALAVLQRWGWVRLGEGSDARSRCAQITGAGREALAKAHPAWAGTQIGLIERFGASRWQRLVQEMTALAECAESIRAERKEDLQ